VYNRGKKAQDVSMTKDTRIPRLVYEYSPEEEMSLEYPTAGVTTTRLVQEACEISRKAQAEF
jgi:hypothetical protein